MLDHDQSLFFHPLNITFGHGRILYAPEGIGPGDTWHPAGWALPGGVRTTDRNRAYAVAVEIDRLTNELKLSQPSLTTIEWPGVTLDRTMRA